MASPELITTSDSSGRAVAEVDRIADACDAADGVRTLNEQARLQLHAQGLRGARLWLHPQGFALLRGTELDLAAHPAHRGRGIGTALASAALADLAEVEAWSHADHPAAARLAGRFEVPRARELVVMSRPASTPLGSLSTPAHVRVRTFRDEDEDALLALNAAAFSGHPEQGGMTSSDFRARRSEEWFDPEGLFLAVPDDPADDRLLGFHWTKVHPGTDPPIGEVYVVGVAPEAAGRGLGTALTRIGLDHLARAGVAEVVLYVEGDNAPALAVYQGQGFARTRTEAQYRGAPRIH